MPRLTERGAATRTSWMKAIALTAASLLLLGAGCENEVNKRTAKTKKSMATETAESPDAGSARNALEAYAPRELVPTPTNVAPMVPTASPMEATAKPEPTTAAGWRNHARELLAADDAAGALAAADKGVELAPESAGSHNVLGRVHLSLGHLGEARAAFERAAELNPESSHVHNNLGLVLIYQGEYEAAAKHLETAVELEPVTHYMWNNLGMALEHLGRFDEARDAYREGIDLGSHLAEENLERILDVPDTTIVDEDLVDPATDADLLDSLEPEVGALY